MTRRTFGSIRTLPSKKFQARYVGPDGGRYNAPNLFVKRAHASTFLSGVETSISNGSWVSPSAPVATSETFGVYAEAWLAKRALTVRTRALYRSQLDRFLLPAFGDQPLALDADLIDLWWDERSVATPTQNAQVYTLLHTILGTATKTRKIGFNPCNIEGASKVRRARSITVLTALEVQALASHFPTRFRALVLVTGFDCLRFGEGTELRRGNVVDGRLRITNGVTWAKDETSGVRGAVVGLPKTEAGSRTVPMPGPVAAAVAAHMAEHVAPGDDALLFPALRGGHLPHSSLTTMLKKAATAIGRPGLTWHDLRHTGAVIWAQDPALNLKDLMGLLGHETPETALLYQHVAAGKLDAAAARLDAHFDMGLAV